MQISSFKFRFSIRLRRIKFQKGLAGSPWNLRFGIWNLGLFIMLGLSASAQTLEWSNTQKLRGNSIFTTIIGEDESGIYVLRHRNKFLSKFVVLERYRHNLGFESSKSYLLKNTRILYCDINETGLLLIKQVFDKKSNSYKIIATCLNGSFETMIPETTILQFKVTEWNFEPEFIIKPSFDHQNYFIFNHELNGSKNILCRYSTMNSKLEVNTKGQFMLKSSLNLETISDLVIDKNLQYTLLAISKKNKYNQLHLTLIEQSGDSNFIKPVLDSTHSLELPLLFYNFFKDLKGVSGFYTSSEENAFEGNFSYQWKNLQHDTEKLIKQPFSQPILKELTGEAKAHNGFLPFTYQPLKVICRTDGGYIKICENTYTQKDQDVMIINGVPSSQGKNIYTFENVLIQNFDSIGKLSWENYVTKNQNTVNDGGILGSVFISASPYSINIIYNDPIATGGDIVMANFLTGGQKEIKIIAKGDEMNAFIIPGEGSQIASDKIIVPVLKDRKFALLKISFKP